MNNQKVTVSLLKLKCFEQEDSEFIFDTQDDEPYVLVMTVDGQNITTSADITIPNVAARLVRIGPIKNFNKNDEKDAPANILWGLADLSAPFTNIDRVFFLVALLENDSANPGDVENRVISAQAALPGLVLVAFARNDLKEQEKFELFVSTARQAMDGTVSLARLAFPDPDDQIGPVQVLRFTDEELKKVIKGAELAQEKKLRFKGDDASYELTFSLTLGFSVLDKTPIAAHERDDDHMELWVVDEVGMVRGNYWNGDWHAWYTLPNPLTTFPQRGHLAALGRHSGHMEVFGVGVDGQLHGIWWDGKWRYWYKLGAPAIPNLPAGKLALLPGAPLAVNSRFRDNIEVWVVGADSQVHGIWWDGDWRDWYTLSGAFFPVGAPLVVKSRNDDHMEIWGIDVDGILRGNWWDGNWHGWYSKPTPDNDFTLVPGGHLAALCRNDDHMEVWSIGEDDRLHGIWWDGSWHDWYTLDGPSFIPGSPLAALSRNDDFMEIWGAGEGDRVHGVWWNGSWKPWYTLGQTYVPTGAPLAALSRNDDHMELWCTTSADLQRPGIYGVWWDGVWRPFYRLG